MVSWCRKKSKVKRQNQKYVSRFSKDEKRPTNNEEVVVAIKKPRSLGALYHNLISILMLLQSAEEKRSFDLCILITVTAVHRILPN